MPDRRLRFKNLNVKAFLICFVAPGFFTAVVASEDTTIKTYADKAEVEIGDPIRYTVEVAHPSNLSVQFPQIPETWGDFEILSSVHKTEFQQEDGHAVDKLQLVLAAYKIGDLKIPSIDVNSGEKRALHVPSLSVRVKSVLPQEPAENIPPKDVKPVIDLPEPSTRSMLMTVPIAVGALFFVSWLLYLKRKRSRTEKALARPVAEDLSPESEALLAIERLLQSTPFGRLFYVQIAIVVKVYLEKRYQLKTLERTTSEILHDMATHKHDGHLIELAQRVFNLCDLAKFSTYVPDEKEAYRLAERAVSMIEIGNSN